MDNNSKRPLSRVVYKAIKCMDREQLSNYITNVYVKGYEAGRKAATPDQLLRTVREGLIDIVGPTRADAILKKLGDTFAQKESENTPQEGDGTTEEVHDDGILE